MTTKENLRRICRAKCVERELGKQTRERAVEAACKAERDMGHAKAHARNITPEPLRAKVLASLTCALTDLGLEKPTACELATPAAEQFAATTAAHLQAKAKAEEQRHGKAAKEVADCNAALEAIGADIAKLDAAIAEAEVALEAARAEGEKRKAAADDAAKKLAEAEAAHIAELAREAEKNAAAEPAA